jgi:hypothetical protein
MLIQGKKMTPDTSAYTRFIAHQQEARQLFSSHKILNPEHFDLIDWETVNRTLHQVPKLFQLFACKQVFSVSAVFKNLSRQKQYSHLSPYCPCCTIAIEDCEHVLTCPEVGRLQNLVRQAEMLHIWLQKTGAPDGLTTAIFQYIKQRGNTTLEDICIETFPEGVVFARSQDKIGWRRFMEGMISRHLRDVIEHHGLSGWPQLSIDMWLSEVVIRLLEITHGQWIYRNLIVHDKTSGTLVTRDKETLMEEIVQHVENGGDGLTEADRWMAEVNIDRLDRSSGERECYWLLALQTAQETRIQKRI